ncbi:MAG: phenylalanine--tRNA ligase subunit beta [Flavobacteriales bacterium]
MRISWNWLRTLIDTDLDPQQAAAVLTSTGLEVESVTPMEPIKGMLQGVVVGHVLECAKHPDADRLSICLVDLGRGEPVQIVCGAPNVAAGQKVLVATVGAVLHMADGNPITIKKSKIRGVESPGMICAEDELGLGGGHEGILVLDPSARVGAPAAEQLGLKSDHVLEIGLTPNRSDAMGHYGVARDLAVALRHREGADAKLTLPDVSAFAPGTGDPAITVTVDAPHAAPRYAGLTLDRVRVGPSPQWMQEALQAIGLKSINNVVDVTNYVQHELGQPLHAFDAAKLEGGRIVVRMAKEGERFTTLDGKERTLSSEDLVIADAARPACIAGVLGGLDSGVTDGTTTVFLESACFEPTLIRRTARRHGLSTDASFRFERGVDPEITVYALQRAALLLQEVAGARVTSAVTDLYPAPRPWRAVTLSFARLDALCGTHIPADAVVEVLRALDCRIVERTEHIVHVEVPPYRVDVHREADLVEEVLRIHGFDNIPLPERLMVPAVHRPEVTLEGLQQRIALHFAARGFREVMTPSLVNGERAVQWRAATEGTLVRLKNPLSAELDVMRPTMLFGLLQAATHNIARQQRDLRLFEKGRVYRVHEGAIVEEERTALLLTGRRWREQWRAEDDAVAAADPLGEVEVLLDRLGALRGLELSSVEMPLLADAVEVKRNGRLLAVIGEVPKPLREAFGVSQPVFCAELMDQAWLDLLRAVKVGYTEVPRSPAVRRDLSLLLAQDVPYAQLEQLAFRAERKLLKRVGLFDVYEGDKLPKGKKSYALSFILQDPEKTLTDEQVDKAMARIRQAFEQEAGAELRG